MTSFRSHWFPVAAVHDVPFRHVHQAELLGQELAVWRADDGFVNVWENRCLHRGVRLTLGINLGDSLKCQYHGWLYSSRSSACTYIPAHPENAPARLICNKVYPAVERYGLIWSRLDGDPDMAPVPALEDRPWLALRGIPVKAPADRIEALLVREGFTRCTDFMFRNDDDGLVLMVQPENTGRCVLRGLARETPQADDLKVLLDCNVRLIGLRDAVEARQ
ncbi:MAG: Rieske 2Fe-2S domain-containing protein [Alphaproteobacteria bacterium]|nr:Rieske 2Fe-2S domain-containing protein [Alphaproteobacteria bacterium]